MVSGEPITVYYTKGANDYDLVAVRYTDAAASASAQPSSTAAPPTPTATPRPTARPTPSPEPTPVAPFHLGVEPFVDGFMDLTFITNAGDGSADLYVVEQRGVIWRVSAEGTVDDTPFLNIVTQIGCCDERGLLGLAFHPGFETNGRFFVDYTDREGNTVVSEFTVAANGTADPDSERQLLGIEQPFENHNGGMLAFGPDGYLYIGTGDGGSGGDPFDNGQSMETLLGKILRIDVDSGRPYGIPADNPFVGQVPEVSSRPEIWDLGMRNPWRFSFDRQTGDLWIGDVGQDAYEEVDAEPAGQGGRNYGWNTMEGMHCFNRNICNMDGLTLPVAEYKHAQGCSITGGYVYRGTALPQLAGLYVYADYCSGRLWALDAAAALSAGSAEPTQYGELSINPTAFGEDEAGELYVVSQGGQVFRLIVE
jgi:glucose/arabinose dehydrogenase